jgi:DNA-binding transcriptional MerR regulator
MIMKQTWKVGELAKIAGLTVRTLRFYDQIGLYSPSDHSDSGHRLYTESDISRLQQILSLKELGLTLDEIKAILSGDHFNLSNIISLQISRIKENLIVQQKLLRELQHVSNLLLRKDRLTVEDFTKLMETMRMSHEKFFTEKRASWHENLDRLGHYLDNNPE